jgi:EEF1A lysine methyltransferase 2
LKIKLTYLFKFSGTYDAISLHPDNPKTKRTLYIKNVLELLNENSLFVITSCNWTEKELMESFGDLFDLEKIIPTPRFMFGGKVGNVVTSIVFKKKK